MEHEQAPYFDALRAYAERAPGRYHVPGHKGGKGADAGLLEALGPGALGLDIPLIVPGIDVGRSPRRSVRRANWRPTPGAHSAPGSSPTARPRAIMPSALPSRASATR